MNINNPKSRKNYLSIWIMRYKSILDELYQSAVNVESKRKQKKKHFRQWKMNIR